MALKRTVKLPPRDKLRTLFRYDSETGQLFWRRRSRLMFDSLSACQGWNSRFADREAFTFINKGYRRGSLSRQSVYAHQVIWKMMTGDDVSELDHIDGNRLNNAWSNLRPAIAGANQRNCAIRSDNASGHVGVVRRGERWIAQIGLRGTTKHIGIYETKEEAISARKEWAEKYGFHRNHGRPA